jgi:hypothetical protein
MMLVFRDRRIPRFRGSEGSSQTPAYHSWRIAPPASTTRLPTIDGTAPQTPFRLHLEQVEPVKQIFHNRHATELYRIECSDKTVGFHLLGRDLNTRGAFGLRPPNRYRDQFAVRINQSLLQGKYDHGGVAPKVESFHDVMLVKFHSLFT